MSRGELTLELRISVNDCLNTVKALNVDEVNLPQGIVTRLDCANSVLLYMIQANIDNAKAVLSVWNTVNDLLANLKAVLSVSSINTEHG